MNSMSSETALEQSQAEAGALTAWKRRVYQVALGVGSLILILSWYMRAPGDDFIAWIYPVFVVLFVVYLILIRYSVLSLPKLETAVFATAALLVIARLAWHFFVLNLESDRLLALTGGHYWSVATLIVASFVVFNRRVGLKAGGAVLAFSILVAVAGLVVSPPDGGLAGEAVRQLLRVHLFLIIILVLASSGAILSEHYSRALIRTELLEEWANVDALTGIANRRAADRRLTQVTAQAIRHGRPLSIIISDIDRFKRVNDEHGHAFGDTVLKEIARRLGQRLRTSDLVARWGGEEFLIIAPETGLNDAARLAERCRMDIAGAPVEGVAVTMTFGVSELRPDDSIDSLLVRADENLYEGKQTGRNKVVAVRNSTEN